MWNKQDEDVYFFGLCEVCLLAGFGFAFLSCGFVCFCCFGADFFCVLADAVVAGGLAAFSVG